MYHIREWLNREGLYATSTITAFHGMNSFMGEGNKRTVFEDKKLSIHDCQNSIRLHQMSDESDAEYINKIRKVSIVCAEFADYLEELMSASDME